MNPPIRTTQPGQRSFAVLCPGLPPLWNKWWNLETYGRTIGALQYISCLMYERTANPIFPAWTPEEGGGPMALGAFGYGPQPCDPENIRFLQDVFAPDRLFSVIDRCQHQLTNPEDVKVAAQMKADFASQLPLLEARLEQLPAILSGEKFLI